MLIVNDDHLQRAGVASLEEPCVYCSKRLASYPLLMSDDTKQTVYHLTCALELVADLLADVFTFFSPPVPSPPLFVLTTQTEGETHAIDRSSPDQDGAARPGTHRNSIGPMFSRADRRRKKEKRPAPGTDSRMGSALVPNCERHD